MGGQQSRRKKKTSASMQDNSKEELTKSLSFHSNDDGTSVDVESLNLDQEVQRTLTPLPEEYPDDNESVPSVMTGLPGESPPNQDLPIYLGNSDETESTVKHDESYREADESTESVYSLDVAHLNSSGEHHFILDPDFDFTHKRLSDSLEAKNEFLGTKGGEVNAKDDSQSYVQDSQSKVGRTCNDFRKRFEGIKVAKKHYHRPVKLDKRRMYKKRVTADSEDNRYASPVENSQNNPYHREIFTNVIFFPDKSKGASPKRYGPKRLGSIYESITQDIGIENSSSSDEYEYDEERSTQTQSRDTISRSRTSSGSKDEHISRKGQKELIQSETKQTDRIDKEKNSNCSVESFVNNHQELTFVEDHFGLHTGSLAEGISRDFQAQTPQSVNNATSTEFSHSAFLSEANREGNRENVKSENKMSEKGKTIDSQGDFKQQHPLQRQEKIIRMSENDGNCQGSNVNTIKTNEKMNRDTVKIEQKEDEQIYEQEVTEICRRCREPGDLCMCLFPDIKTVMSVTVLGEKKPCLSYLRYLTINDKEINWSSLKSSQALFIKGLKSHITEISGDNRVALEFDLPFCKGFVSPYLTRPDETKSDGSMFDKSKTFKMAIDKPSDLLLLSERIDSSGNIIKNDFDESSDDGVGDFDKIDEGGFVSRESDDNSVNFEEDCMGRECHLKPNGFSENVAYKPNTTISKTRNTFYKGSGFNNDHQNLQLHCSNLQHGRNKDCFCSVGNFSLMDHLILKLRNETFLNQNECSLFDMCTDKAEQAFDDRYTENCFSHELSYWPMNLLFEELNDRSSFETDDDDDDDDEDNDDHDEHCSFESGESNLKIDGNIHLLLNANHLEPEALSYYESQHCRKESVSIRQTQEAIEKSEAMEKVKNGTVIETENLDKILKDTVSSKCSREHFQLKQKKTSIEDDNRLKAIEDNIVNDYQQEDNHRQEHLDNDKTIVGEQLSKAVDKNLTVTCSLNNTDTVNIRATINETEMNGSLEVELKDSFNSESDSQKCKNEGRGIFEVDEMFNSENDVQGKRREYQKNELVAEKDLSDLTGTQSCKLFDLKSECLHKEENKKLEKTTTEETYDTESEDGNVLCDAEHDITVTDDLIKEEDRPVLYKVDHVMSGMDDLIKLEGENATSYLRSVLKRKQTKIEDDNRLADTFSDEKCSRNVETDCKLKEENVTKKVSSKSNVLEEESDTPPNLDVDSPKLEFTTPLGRGSLKTVYGVTRSHERTRGLSGLLRTLTQDSDLDFTLPPEEFKKCLDEKYVSASEILEKLKQKRKHKVKELRCQQKRSLKREKSVILKIDAQGNVERVESVQTRSTIRQLGGRSLGSLLPDFPVSRHHVPFIRVDDNWVPVIRQEKANCLESTRVPENCRCTVLCVDVSASMQGSPWQQIKTFVSDFLTGLERKKQDEIVKEYVAMVTFGYRTSILIQPTLNYKQVIEALGFYKPDGGSPVLPGLALSILFEEVRKEQGQRPCQVHDIVLGPRVILLSDGHPSLSSLIAISDEFLDDIQHQKAVREVNSSLLEWELPSEQHHIDCVPVGENPNIDMLQSICDITKGRLVMPADVQVLVNSTHNHHIAANVALEMGLIRSEQLDIDKFTTTVQRKYPATTPRDLEEMVTLVKTAHTSLQNQLQSDSDTDSLSSTGVDTDTDSDDMLQMSLFQEVFQRPSVTEDILEEASGEGQTEDSHKQRGKVFVNRVPRASTSSDACKDMFEEVPDDIIEPCKTDGSIDIGYKVRRGQDWHWKNQDGGRDKVGTVRSIQTDGIVCVKWPNRNIGNYRYNQAGVYDVIVCDPSDPYGTKLFEDEMNKRNEEETIKAMSSLDPVEGASATEEEKC